MALTQSQSDLGGWAPHATARKLAITVLSGGPSREREISLQSGRAVAEALESQGHTIHVADIAPDHLAALERDVDCVFIALHGTFGEDGQVQAILEQRGLRYCGTGSTACALAMDKARAKARFAELGLPTPGFTVATQETMDDALGGRQLPVVVKPVQEGSSLACHIVREASSLRPAVEQVVASHGACLIEDYIPGREITVGILGDVALPPIEIRTPRDFYDYDAKYVDDRTEYVFDIDLPERLMSRIVEMSLAAHHGLGCRDFSRVDWRVDPRRGEAYLLEVNVIPGLTSHSLLPKAAVCAGMSIAEMCGMIVDLAMRRGIDDC